MTAIPGGLVWGRLVSLGKYDSLDCDKDTILIGRGKKSDIRFPDELGISNKHCTITRTVSADGTSHSITVQDISTNGTFVDGNRLQKGERELSDGSELSFYKSETEKITFLFQDLFCPRTAGSVRRRRYERGEPQRKYDIRKELGSGAFATVKLVIERNTGRPFAMKVLDKKRVAMSSHSKRDTMQDEIELLSQIEHPNIVCMEEVFETDKELFLILELVTGGELFDRIVNKGRLAEREARPLFRQMVSAVQYLHAKGIAHRDLKPENILLCRKRATSDLSSAALDRTKTLAASQLDNIEEDDERSDDDEWVVKLADFGLSRMVTSGSFMETLAGTPQYVAPEVLFGIPSLNKQNHSEDSEEEETGAKGYGKEVDIWSLGVILYVMLSGSAPFDDDSQPRLFENIRAGQFDFDADCWGNISDDAKKLIRRMLCVDVAKRISLDEIERCAWLSARTKRKPKPAKATSRTRRRK